MNLQQKQKDLLGKMLTQLDADSTSVQTFGNETSWKILIYDSFCRDVLAPLFSVGELKKLGVTLYMMLHTKRERITDVPVVYFVRPLQENMERILEDLSASIYDKVYLNFTSLPSDKLTWFASRVASLPIDPDSVIVRVCDQHAEFISLDKHLYSMNHKLPYASMFARQLSESAAHDYLIKCAHSMYTIVATLGAIPIIRAPAQQGPAQIAAKMLNQLVSAHLRDLQAAQLDDGALWSQRPLLLIFDRHVDMAAPMHHSLAYASLLDDVLGIAGNRVHTDTGVQELDFNEAFWTHHGHQAMPEVAEAVQHGLARIKREVAVLKSGENLVTSELSTVIGQMPILTRQKKQLQLHTELGSALVSAVRARASDELCAVEEQAMAGDQANGIADAKQLVSAANSKSTLTDKLRLAVTYALSEGADDKAGADLLAAVREAAEATLEDTAVAEAEVVLGALSHASSVLHDRRMSKLMSTQQQQQQQQQQQGESSSMFAKLRSSVLATSAGAISYLAKAGQRAIAVPLARVVAAHLADDASLLQASVTMDPQASLSGAAATSTAVGGHRNVLVCMLGGGNYAEYSALQQLSDEGIAGIQGRIDIGYCATGMLNSTNMIAEWAKMGKDGDELILEIKQAHKE